MISGRVLWHSYINDEFTRSHAESVQQRRSAWKTDCRWDEWEMSDVTPTCFKGFTAVRGDSRHLWPPTRLARPPPASPPTRHKPHVQRRLPGADAYTAVSVPCWTSRGATNVSVCKTCKHNISNQRQTMSSTQTLTL